MSDAPKGLRTALMLGAVLLIPLLVLAGVDSEWGFIGAPGSDVLYDFHYDRAMTAGELERGRLPMWNPHTMCGFPQIAAMQTGALYPVTMLIGQAAAPERIWYWSVLLHGALLGLFAYLWLEHGLGRKPLAAFAGTMIVTLSSFFFLRVFAGHFAMVCSLPWLLAILWRLERVLRHPSPRATVALALAVAMLVYAGYPLFLFYAALVASFRGMWLIASKRGAALAPLAWGIGGFVLGVAFSGPQLFPALELSKLAHRAQVDPSFATQFSLPPEALLTMIAPGALGDGVTAEGRYWGRWIVWEASAFLGVVALIIGLCGSFSDRKRALPWIGFALFALALALGRYTGLYDLFLTVVPGADTFRAPNRYVLVATLALAAAVSAVFERLSAGSGNTRLAGIILLVIALAGGVMRVSGDGLHGAWWQELVASSADPLERIEPLPEGEEFAREKLVLFTNAFGITALFAAAAGITLLVMSRRASAAKTGTAILVVVLTAELLGGGFRYLTDQSDPRSPQDWAPGVAEHLARSGSLLRVASFGDIRDVGRCEVSGLDHVGGYDPLMLARYGELMNALKGKQADEPVIVAGHDWPHIESPSGLTRLIGIGHRIALGRPEATAAPLKQFRRANVYDVRDPMPRAFVVPTATVVPDRDDRLARLLASDFDPAKEVFLDEEPRSRHALAGPTTVTTRRLADDRTYEMTVDGPGGGFLVFVESSYPGWSCTIDGVVTEILTANHAFQAVALPPGAKEVRFRFTSGPMMGGTWLAVVMALLTAGWLLLSARKSRPKSDS